MPIQPTPQICPIAKKILGARENTAILKSFEEIDLVSISWPFSRDSLSKMKLYVLSDGGPYYQ
jgi:hypothetical protein